jgi:Dyp-type peroxidase family
VPEADLGDIQGDILRAYGNRYARTTYVFVGVPDAAAGRAWLSGLVDRVTTAERWPRGHRPESTLNVALTCAGLAALGVSEAVRDSFSTEFRLGMAARADLLGDAGPSVPSGWDPGLGTGDAHVLVTINARSAEALRAALGELESGIAAAGLSVIHTEHGKLLGGAREHFGYSDGFAQPAIEGATEDRTPGGGVPLPGGKWRPLALGEFILGYGDEETRNDPTGRLPSAPDAPLGRNGTYLVWRKLHQDVALFRRALRDAAALYHGGDEEKLAAKVVGRWRDGTPLVRSPDAPDPGFNAKTPGGNDFRYAADEDGARCPIGAHIRRSNPRDALDVLIQKDPTDAGSQLSFRHRMIRRGMPYGPPLPDGVTEDDGEPRGLVFTCFVGSISRQFEAVQVQWLNDGNIFHLGHDKDFMLGDPDGTGKMTVQGDPPFFLGPQGCFVTTRGGEYLFVPGITALAAIADGVAG